MSEVGLNPDGGQFSVSDRIQRDYVPPKRPGSESLRGEETDGPAIGDQFELYGEIYEYRGQERIPVYITVADGERVQNGEEMRPYLLQVKDGQVNPDSARHYVTAEELKRLPRADRAA